MITNNKNKCLKDLNNWLKSKYPENQLNIFDIESGNIHCYAGNLSMLANNGNIHTRSQYIGFILEIINPILIKYNITKMTFGIKLYKKINNKWIFDKLTSDIKKEDIINYYYDQ